MSVKRMGGAEMIEWPNECIEGYSPCNKHIKIDVTDQMTKLLIENNIKFKIVSLMNTSFVFKIR